MTKDLTLTRIKELVAFPKDSLAYSSLIGMIDCWYGIAESEDKTEEEALEITLIKLGDFLLKLK